MIQNPFKKPDRQIVCDGVLMPSVIDGVVQYNADETQDPESFRVGRYPEHQFVLYSSENVRMGSGNVRFDPAKYGEIRNGTPIKVRIKFGGMGSWWVLLNRQGKQTACGIVCVPRSLTDRQDLTIHPGTLRVCMQSKDPGVSLVLARASQNAPKKQRRPVTGRPSTFETGE